MELSNANHHRKKWRKFCFYFHIFYFFIPAKGLAVSLLGLLLLSVSAMSIKIKGIYKSFKYISQIFVVKEREMEIGHPTDVKHVAHIGWDGSSGSAPSWMGKFRPPSDGERRDSNPISLSTWSSQDFEERTEPQARSGDMFKDIGPDDVPKKTRRKKSNSCSSAKTSKESRSAKPKAKYSNIERQRNVL